MLLINDKIKEKFLSRHALPSSPQTSDLYKIELNPLTLSFPEKFEGIYQDDQYKKVLTQVRVSILLGIAFYSIFGILDAVLIPELKLYFWIIRYGVVAPVALSLFFFSFSPHYKKYMQASLASLVFVSGLGIIAMILKAPPQSMVNSSYYAGLMLVFMFGYTFFTLRFIWASLAGWLIVVFYEFAVIWSIFILERQIEIHVFINNNFFFISANVIGMLACYSMEAYSRRDFFLARLLRDEKEKVKYINLDLEQRVQKRTAQLNKTNEDLKREMEERENAEKRLLQSQKMQAIGTLAGGIAHDFNNILTAIIGYSELGLFKKKMDDKKTRISFEQIHQAGERAKDLVQQILTFSRKEDEKYSPVNVGPIIKETLKLIRATIPKNIDISLGLNTESDLVLASSTQLHQVLMNLCTNAVHAMKDKSGVLSITLEDIYLSKQNKSISAILSEGPYLKIKVTDTGTGIDPSFLEQIFDPFFTTKKPGEGTGMGLSVVHGIIESHGGTITLESELGKGSTFHILLPKIDAAEKTFSKTTGEIPRGKERILFVDDEESIIALGKEMLEEFGYAVTITKSPMEAFKTFCDSPTNFDLVITDNNMPEITGFELIDKILMIKPGQPVILCSGYSDKTDIEKARSMNLKLISKPLLMNELANAIREVLD